MSVKYSRMLHPEPFSSPTETETLLGLTQVNAMAPADIQKQTGAVIHCLLRVRDCDVVEHDGPEDGKCSFSI